MVDVWAGSSTTYAGSTSLFAGRTNPPHKGRLFILKQGDVIVACLRTLSLNISGETVDVTNKDDQTYRTLLPRAGVSAVSVSAEGIFDDDDIIKDIRAAAGTKSVIPFEIEYEYDGTITGNYQVASFENSGEYNGAVNYSISLESSGQVTIIG